MNRRIFIKTMIINSGMFAFCSHDQLASQPGIIKMIMIYNNTADNGNYTGDAANYTKDWGLSVWIEQNNDAVLFDTGRKPGILWKNIVKSGINIKKLSKIVISHNHNDHIDGLPIILEKLKSKLKVFVPQTDLEKIKSKYAQANLFGIKGPAQINDYLWSTGEMTGTIGGWSIHEQSIVVSQNDTMILLTGCSHPGIVTIAKQTLNHYSNKKLRLICGGFHLRAHSMQQIQQISTDLKKLNVGSIAPSHCTGDTATRLFRNEWKVRFIDFNLGASLKA